MSTVDKLTVIVSTNGRVVLPKTIRRQRRWSAGTRLVVENTPDGVLLRAASPFPEKKPADVFASLRYRRVPKSLEKLRGLK